MVEKYFSSCFPETTKCERWMHTHLTIAHTHNVCARTHTHVYVYVYVYVDIGLDLEGVDGQGAVSPAIKATTAAAQC